MNGSEKTEIIKAIGELKGEIKVLNTKYDSLSSYMFKDLKEDIEEVCGKVEECMTKAEKCYHENQNYQVKNIKWIATTIIALIIGVLGGLAYLIG